MLTSTAQGSGGTGSILVELPDADALVAAARAHVVDVVEQPSTPNVGIPALRMKRPSVAPVLITGTTGTPGNIDATFVSVAFITSSLSTAGLLGAASSTSET